MKHFNFKDDQNNQLCKDTTRQLNIKDKTYYFYNDLINVLNFEASHLKLDKKQGKKLIFILLVMLIKSQIRM